MRPCADALTKPYGRTTCPACSRQEHPRDGRRQPAVDRLGGGRSDPPPRRRRRADLPGRAAQEPRRAPRRRARRRADDRVDVASDVAVRAAVDESRGAHARPARHRPQHRLGSGRGPAGQVRRDLPRRVRRRQRHQLVLARRPRPRGAAPHDRRRRDRDHDLRRLVARDPELQRHGSGEGQPRELGALPGRRPGAGRHPRERGLGRPHRHRRRAHDQGLQRHARPAREPHAAAPQRDHRRGRRRHGLPAQRPVARDHRRGRARRRRRARGTISRDRLLRPRPAVRPRARRQRRRRDALVEHHQARCSRPPSGAPSSRASCARPSRTPSSPGRRSAARASCTAFATRRRSRSRTWSTSRSR